MAKTQKQKLYDDLEGFLDKYPNLTASSTMLTMQSWMDSVWHRLRPAGKTKRALLKDVHGRYRIV